MSTSLLAVHVSDGVLGWPAVVVGFVLAALLAGLAAYKVREDEIPRIALMTAAFFVASSIHVKLGPTSVHLLLNGLVGVILRGRAPLAILVGVTLQALLIPHGGISTIGVNACTEMIPALVAAGLFALMARVGERHRWFRWLIVGVAALTWGACLMLAVGLVGNVDWAGAVRWSNNEGLRVRLIELNGDELRASLAFALRPLALLALAAFAGICVFVEIRRPSPAGFARGALVGMIAVLLTTTLTGAALALGAADGGDEWDTFVTAVFLAHLPLALLEGLIVGSIVSFLWRVKPEMLRPRAALPRVAVLAVFVSLMLASSASAHSMEIERSIDRERREVTITCVFEGGDPPKRATAIVLRPDLSVLSEGKLDEKGRYTFTYDKLETLVVSVTEGGHKATTTIRAAELGGTEVAAPPVEGKSRLRDLATGLALLLGGAAFAMAWRNGVRLRRMEGK